MTEFNGDVYRLATGETGVTTPKYDMFAGTRKRVEDYFKDRVRVPYGGVTQERLAEIRDTDRSEWYPEEKEHQPFYGDLRDNPMFYQIPEFERSVIQTVSDASGMFGNWITRAFNNGQPITVDEVADAAGAKQSTLAYAGKYLLKGLEISTDWMVEGIERTAGMFSQYKAMRNEGKTDEFWKDFRDVFTASRYYWDVSGNLSDGVIAGSGDMALGKIREWLKDPEVDKLNAVDKEEHIHRLLQQDLGLNYIRGQIFDAWRHMVYDPSLYASLLVPFLGEAYAGTKVGKFLKVLDVATNPLQIWGEMKSAASRVYTSAKVVEDATERLAEATAAMNRTKELVEELRPVGRMLVEGSDEVIGEYIIAQQKYEEAARTVQRLYAYQQDVISRRPPNRVMEGLADLTGRYTYNLTDDLAKTVTKLKNESVSLWKPWTWFQLTPRSIAAELYARVGDHGKIMFNVAETEDDIVQMMQALVKGSDDPRLGMTHLTIEGQSLRVAVKDAQVRIIEKIADYKAAEGTRAFLGDMARIKGMSKGKFLSWVDEVGIDTAMAEVNRLIQEGGEVVGQIAPASLRQAQSKLEWNGFIDMLDSRTPFDMPTLKAHIINELMDSTAELAWLQFGGKAKSWWTKMADSAKSAQTLAFLRLNPAYPVRNLLNNELTMWARGVWGAMSDKQITTFWRETGIEPNRLAEGYGMAGDIEQAALQALREGGEGANAAKFLRNASEGKKYGYFNQFQQALGRINLGWLDGGKWASMFEQMASRRAMTTAYMQWWKGNWKPGIGYDALQDFARTRGLDISILPEEVVARLENGLRAAKGPQGIDDVIFDLPRYSVDEALDAVAKAYGRSSEEVRDILGDEIIEELQGAMRGIETVDEANAALGAVIKRTEQHLQDAATRDLEVIAERAAAQIKTNPAQYLNLMSEQSDEAYEMMEGGLNEFAREAERIRAIEDPARRKAAWDRMFARKDMHYQNVQNRIRARYEGVLRAGRKYGVNVDTQALRPLQAMHEAVNEFHEQKSKIMRALYDAIEGGKSKKVAYRKAYDLVEQEYTKLMRSTLENNRKMDNIMYRVLESGKAEMLPAYKAARETVHSIRQRTMTEVRDIYRELAEAADEATRAGLYKRLEEVRLAGLIEAHKAEKEGYYMIQQGTAFGSIQELDPETVRIFNTHFGSDTLMQSSGGFEERVRQLMKEGFPERLARRQALQEAQGLGRTVGGRLEDYLTTRGNNPRWQRANQILMEAERAGEPLHTAVPKMAEAIPAQQERVRYMSHLARWAEDDQLELAARHQLHTDWTSMSAQEIRQSLQDEDFVLLTFDPSSSQDLFVRITNDGYTPVTVHNWSGDGGYSLLVPAMPHGKAIGYADEFGTDRVILGGKGIVDGDGIVPYTVGFDNQYLVRDIPISFDVEEAVVRRPLVVDLEGKGGKVDLIAYADEGTTFVEPGDARSVIRLDPESALRRAEHPGYVDHYKWTVGGLEPAGRGELITARVPVEKIYDIGEDPLGFAARFGFTGDMTGQELTKLERHLLENGYAGYRYTKGASPNEIRVFDTIQSRTTDTLYQGGVGPIDKRTGITGIYTSYTGEQMKADWMQFYGVSAEEADVLYQVTEARARAWSLLHGREKEEWYTSRIAGFDAGEAVGRGSLYHHKRGFPSKQTTKAIMDRFEKTGVINPEDIAAMVKNGAAPQYTEELVNGINKARSRLLGRSNADRQLLPRDVAKAYTYALAGQRQKDMVLDAVVKKAKASGTGDWWKDLGKTSFAGDWSPHGRGRVERLYVRSEDIMATYLQSPAGQKFLKKLDQGVLDAAGMEEIEKVFAVAGTTKASVNNFKKGIKMVSDTSPAGYFNKIRSDGLVMGGLIYPNEVTEELTGLLDLSQMNIAAHSEKFFNDLMELPGLGRTKSSFAGGLLGMGNRTTVDIRSWRFLVGGEGTAEFTDVLRQQLMEDFRFVTSKGFGKHIDTISNAIDEAVDAAISKLDLPEGIMPDSAKMYVQSVIFDQMGRPANQKAMWNSVASFFQDGAGDAKGAVTFLEDGRAVISALEAPDFSTAIHELAHIFRRDLGGPDLDTITKWLKVKTDDLGNLVWSTAQEEKFARAFEKYVRQGIAPTEELETAFTKMQDWMTEIYKSIRGTELDVRFKRDVREVFDNLLGAQHPREVPGFVDNTIGVTKFNQIASDQPIMSQGLDQLWYRQGGGLADAISDNLKDQLGRKPIKIGDLDPAQQALVRAYATRVKAQVGDAQFTALKFAEIKRDAALLNYSRRSYFDNGLMHFAPFAFWGTHSMFNWVLWSTNKPYIMGNFLRMKRLMRHVESSTPNRFKGFVRTPLAKLPFVPDWLGDIYVNPLRIGLPMDQWIDPLDRLEEQGYSAMRSAFNSLQRKLDEGEITQEQFDEAIANRSESELWQTALTEARGRREPMDPADSLQALMSPHAPLMWGYHWARGTPEKIGPFLPATRTIKGVTALLGIGPAGGVNPEGWLREKLGLPRFDNWDPYRAERMLANMAADGEITADEARQAMISHEGPLWEKAVKRAGVEYGVLTLGSFFGVPLKAYPTGEEESRRLVDELYSLYDEGDAKKINAFYDEHPEVVARMALYDTPEQKLSSFLEDQIWDKWHDLTSLEKKSVVPVLGEEFEQMFLDSQTRNPDNVAPETMQIWLNLLSDRAGMPPPEIAQRAQVYYNEREQRFELAYPDLFETQDTYFSIKKGPERKKYLKEHPELKSYWDWRRDWMLRNPEVAPYLTDSPPEYETARQAVRAQEQQPHFTLREWSTIMEPSMFRLMMDVSRGGPISTPLMEGLEALAERLGTTSDKVIWSFDASVDQEMQGGYP